MYVIVLKAWQLKIPTNGCSRGKIKYTWRMFNCRV